MDLRRSGLKGLHPSHSDTGRKVQLKLGMVHLRAPRCSRSACPHLRPLPEIRGPRRSQKSLQTNFGMGGRGGASVMSSRRA